MTIAKKALSIFLTLVCVMSISGVTASAIDTSANFNKTTLVLNEFDAATQGKSENEVEEIRKKYIDFYYELKNAYSEKELLEAGYTREQVKAIVNYDGDPTVVRSLAASVSLSQRVVNYTYSGGKTSAKIKFSATWYGISFWQFRDMICVAWSEGFYVDDLNVSATYKSTKGSSTVTYSAPSNFPHVSKKINDLGNAAVEFRFDKQHGTRYKLKKVSGDVSLSKLSRVPEFSCLVAYGESCVMFSPSVTVTINGISPSVTFKGACVSIATELKHYTL